MAARSVSAWSRIWFPLSLAGLLLLGIPGLILLAMNVLGLQHQVNQWMQDRLYLTYHLPLPLWAAFLLLAVPFLVMLLYFLKLKRKPLVVPSTFLWKKSIEDLHVNTLFQWLRDNILLLLQLLTLLTLIYAVMAFQFHGTGTQGQHYIIMIDNSASMAATDATPTRLEQAKKDAIDLIDAHSDQDFGMVIVFNSAAEIRQSYTSERDRLRSAVRAIEQTQRPTHIDEALTLAASLANPTRSTEDLAAQPNDPEPGKERTYAQAEGIPTAVHVFSDGRFPDVKEFSQGNLDLRMHLIGEPGREKVDNVAIVGMSATRDEKDPSKLQVLVGVRNYRPKPVQVKVNIDIYINGQHAGDVLSEVAQPQGVEVKDKANAMVPERRLETLPPEPGKEEPGTVDRPGEGTAAFDLNDLDDRTTVVLEASMPGIKDQFPLDDKAWLVIGVVRKARVLIVSNGNKILDAFFEQPATKKVATVKYIEPGDLDNEEKYRKPSRAGEFDLIIFDRCAPKLEAEMPSANTFFIDELPPPFKRAGLPKLEAPHIKGWPAKHPLLRYLTALYDVGIAEAFNFDLKDERVPPRTPRLLESDKDAAVMFVLGRQSYSDLVMAFALINDDGQWMTNWPLQPSFPLFMRNVLYTLGNVSDAAGEETVQPGQVKSILPDTAVKTIEVTNPAGEGETLKRTTNRPDFQFGKTDRVGVYQVRWEGGQRAFAVNLFDDEESNIEPRPAQEVQIGTTTLANAEKRPQPHETWKWVALGALVLLLVEWYVYNRRIFV